MTVRNCHVQLAYVSECPICHRHGELEGHFVIDGNEHVYGPYLRVRHSRFVYCAGEHARKGVHGGSIGNESVTCLVGRCYLGVLKA